jgi:hypothetical protein
VFVSKLEPRPDEDRIRYLTLDWSRRKEGVQRGPEIAFTFLIGGAIVALWTYFA